MARQKSIKFQGIYYETLQNNDKSYYITYKNEYGKKVWVKIGKYSEGIRENYCNQKRMEILNRQRLGEEPPLLLQKKKQAKLTLDSIAELYFKDRELHSKDNNKTKSKYNTLISKYLGTDDLNFISYTDIVKLQKKLVDLNYAPATINNATAFVSTLYNYAINIEKYNGEIPTKKIKQLKVSNERDRYLTKEECLELLKNLEDDNEMYLFTKLALSTGGRLESILSIKKKDIDFTHNVINLFDIKNNSWYKGFFNDSLKELLKCRCNDISANDAIVEVPSRTVRRKMKVFFDDLFNQGLESSDRKNRVVIHSLRHTFASLLAIAGTPIFTIQKLMNHRDIKSTLRYAKLAPDSGKEAVIDLGI